MLFSILVGGCALLTLGVLVALRRFLVKRRRRRVGEKKKREEGDWEEGLRQKLKAGKDEIASAPFAWREGVRKRPFHHPEQGQRRGRIATVNIFVNSLPEDAVLVLNDMEEKETEGERETLPPNHTQEEPPAPVRGRPLLSTEIKGVPNHAPLNHTQERLHPFPPEFEGLHPAAVYWMAYSYAHLHQPFPFHTVLGPGPRGSLMGPFPGAPLHLPLPLPQGVEGPPPSLTSAKVIIAIDARKTHLGGFCINSAEEVVQYYSTSVKSLPWKLTSGEKADGRLVEAGAKGLLASLILFQAAPQRDKELLLFAPSRWENHESEGKVLEYFYHLSTCHNVRVHHGDLEKEGGWLGEAVRALSAGDTHTFKELFIKSPRWGKFYLHFVRFNLVDEMVRGMTAESCHTCFHTLASPTLKLYPGRNGRRN